ncbi:MAG: PH domain-containing protein [Phycisphaerales bacterium]|nr:PH domain-containing protein [Phycisphaerales bacterium]MCB9856270.1 PH domain-containing protein [Phycisphaerales bacterium]MCB9863291.1 PH domain-containing protein [Phycisphaerales bacterium]
MPQTAEKLRAKLYCHACGKRIHPASRFCRHCGAKSLAKVNTPDNDPKKFLTGGKPAPPPDVHHDPAQELPVWHGRPAWRAFSPTWLVWFAMSVALLLVASSYGGRPLVQAVWVFIAGSGVGLFVRDALIVYSRRYHLTTQRLFVHRGILVRVTDQMELIRVDDVRQSQSILDRILNTGHLEIFSSDETDETIRLRSIPDPEHVAEEIRVNTRGVRNKGSIAVEKI